MHTLTEMRDFRDVLNQLSTIGETPLQEARASQLHQPCCLFGETSSSSSPSTSSQKSYCGLDFGIAPRIVPSQSYTDTQNEPRIELTQPWADSHMFQGSPAFPSGGGVNGSTSTWLPQQNDLSRLLTTATSFGLDGRGDGGVGKIHPIGSQSIFSQATPDAAGATCTPSYMFGFGREFNFEGIPGGEELKDGEMGGNLGGGSNSSSEVFNGMLPGIPSSLESGGLGGLGFVDSGAGMWTSSYGCVAVLCLRLSSSCSRLNLARLDGWDAYIESIAGGMGFATTPFADGGLGGPPGGESSSQAGNSGGR
ncbi:hypothetical protein OF83DRAFT_179310 [Amylostereum chailletii]|nr:hypothetical protein OF83DRAFT_179310 [Amylostereum chailletii]